MPKVNVTYNVFISCTSDIVEEVDIIKNEINNLNSRFKKLPVRLEHLYWKEHLETEYGHRAQESINRQLVNEADIGIIIIDNRLGSDTGKYESGVIEEINILISRGKKICVYFSDKKLDKNSLYDSEFILEKSRVNEFKEKFGKKAIYRTYKDLKDLEVQINKDLNNYILTVNNMYTITIKHKDEVSILNLIIISIIFISVILNLILIYKLYNVDAKKEIATVPITAPPDIFIPNSKITTTKDLILDYQKSLIKIKKWQFWYNTQIGSNYYDNNYLKEIYTKEKMDKLNELYEKIEKYKKEGLNATELEKSFWNIFEQM